MHEKIMTHTPDLEEAKKVASTLGIQTLDDPVVCYQAGFDSSEEAGSQDRKVKNPLAEHSGVLWVAWVLRYFGMRNIRVLDGGAKKWKNEQREHQTKSLQNRRRTETLPPLYVENPEV
mmetsp:Transcript_19651/g.30322  ORF Transcript_19651/g.30322 Transcript_19651/m.30322 type:complete len:118 (+) Transcript_19651:251-604(+)